MLWLATHFPLLGFEERCLSFGALSKGGDTAAPAVLVEDNRVVQANDKARLAGIAVGCTLATAHTIVPELAHFHRDPLAERQRLALLARTGYRYTSRVSLAPPDALLLEVRGSLRLFGSLAAIANELADRYRRLGHEQRMAVAPTPLASLVLSRAGNGNLSEAAAERPVRVALHGVPLVHTDLSPKELERLANMGVTRIGELLKLPAQELGKRFGQPLIDYLARLTGRKADPREYIEPPERFRSSVHLLEPVRGKDALLFPMRRLTEELARWLANRQLGVNILAWTVKPLTGPSVVLTVEFAEPRVDGKALLALSKLKLDNTVLPEEAMSVSLHADSTAPLATATADLLAMTEHPAASCTELVDSLTAKLGDDAVRRLRVVDDHRPERAWSFERAGPLRSAKSAAAGTRSTANPRPLWLANPPKPVDARLFELLSGPERIETGWWDTTLHRDYFTAVSKHGARCWLYRDQDERWYLHGYFA